LRNTPYDSSPNRASSSLGAHAASCGAAFQCPWHTTPPPDHRLNVQWFPLFRYSPLTRWDSGTIKCSRNLQSIQCADADVQTRRQVDAQEATSTDSRRVCVANSLGVLFRVASHDRGWRQRHENRQFRFEEVSHRRRWCHRHDLSSIDEFGDGLMRKPKVSKSTVKKRPPR
jgi:hypothetical protein